jgi:hypothetical protein
MDGIGKRNVCSNLATLFAVSIYAYAVMSIDCHLVLWIEEPDFSDEEVADRCLKLCHGRKVQKKARPMPIVWRDYAGHR